MADAFFEEEGSRLLTPHAFEFVLDGEMKRAVRSQNYLTLVVLETRREWDGMTMTADDGTVEEVARIVGHEVRDTDLIGNTETGVLSLVLLDADYDNTTKVIDRLVQRIDDYDFSTPLRISVGAACYPTHAVDVCSLKNRAMAHPALSTNGTAGSCRHAAPLHLSREPRISSLPSRMNRESRVPFSFRVNREASFHFCPPVNRERRRSPHPRPGRRCNDLLSVRDPRTVNVYPFAVAGLARTGRIAPRWRLRQDFRERKWPERRDPCVGKNVNSYCTSAAA
jgi:GGDEF domain-containing protein